MRGRPFDPDSTPSGRDHGSSGTLVMDESAEPTSSAGAEEARASVRPPFVAHDRFAATQRHTLGPSDLVALVATAAILIGTAVMASQPMNVIATPAADHGHYHTEEQIVFVTPRAPEPAAEAPAQPQRTAPADVPRVTEPSASPSVPTTPAVRDSVAVGDPAVQPAADDALLRPANPSGRLPSPGALGAAAAGAAARRAPTGCAAPCREAASVSVGPGVELARRDSILAARMQEVVEKAGPPQSQGIYFPLPFGGPTKEERQRDSLLHARYRERLRALMQRYDSAKADSIARGLIKP